MNTNTTLSSSSKILLSSVLLVTAMGIGSTFAATGSTDEAKRFGQSEIFSSLTEDQKTALQEVKGDKEATAALFESYGIDMPERGEGKGRGKKGEGKGNSELRDQVDALTEDQQAEIKALRQAKDHAGAIALMESYGIVIPEEVQERQAQKAAVTSALEANDYAAFVEAAGESKMAEKVTAENFAQFVALHAARESGDMEAAQEIAAELGFEKKGGKGMKGQRGEAGENTDRSEMRGEKTEIFSSLTEDQQAALEEVKGDREAMQALLESYGIDMPERGEGKGRGNRGE